MSLSESETGSRTTLLGISSTMPETIQIDLRRLFSSELYRRGNENTCTWALKLVFE
ncbi:MAG: hypothetical protein JWQ87_2650, partial [Candidatus Sulfotelmatobacter sp.]|nr:hypothetical protein [Candidatus Sulfotelmatobacter sp.]